ncbi:MAG: flagellar protein FlbD [Thermotoga sp.]|nr:flagellar FlbD family protein [Thermotogota bacterium]RKX55308.1 MAG: flagellar protein FlbD [Thermotoga sp.]
MIELTRFNGKTFYLNAEKIEMVECTPDTVITLEDSKKFVVKESVEEVVNRIIQYKRMINQTLVVDDKRMK